MRRCSICHRTGHDRRRHTNPSRAQRTRSSQKHTQARESWLARDWRRGQRRGASGEEGRLSMFRAKQRRRKMGKKR
ncbi:MAG: hypothetical protein EPO21_13075 [Chloroflexota bacterium]|nr:MAG: hypothetical protein EPO21_13075 [Chloroflexota bacterium]